MRISLIGYGKTTRAVAKALGGGQTFFDDKAKSSFRDEDGNIIYPSSEFNPKRSDIEILTPSIPPSHKILKVAQNPVSEYDLFLAPPELTKTKNTLLERLFAKDVKSIWISGTNGKTTTTQMVTHLLKAKGALSGGNIGTPLGELSPKAFIWVLETSSYTLHHTKFAYPDIYLLLPITPDHLSWHGSKASYIRDKLSVLERMQEGQLALIPKGLPLPKSDAWIVEYDGVEFLEEFFSLDSSKLRYKGAFLEDAMLALAVERTLFDGASYELLNGFKLDRHRQEEINDRFGRLWVNDSKATNLDATLKAVEVYSDKKIHLILGGDDKGVEMEPLIKYISNFDITLYTIGSNSKKLSSLAKRYGVKVFEFEYLRDAQREIDKNLKEGEVALLSPAASSLDQFSSYAKRGDEFIDFVKSI